MDGGDLIATGSSSCIFSPNLPCKKNSKIDDILFKINKQIGVDINK